MHLIDLHCDTLYKAVTKSLPLDDKTMDVSPYCTDNNSHRLQCYAIWIPDNISGEEAEALSFSSEKILKNECKRCNIKLLNEFSTIRNDFNNYKSLAIFTIENALALNGKVENIKKFADLGVKMMTLTWNDSNLLGDGASIKSSKGITKFGKSVVAEMEKNKIIVDVSHSSEKMFFDVAEISKLPFVASHSNSRTLTNHRRNLSDEQLKIIVDRKGLVGINFYKAFLSDLPDKACKYDILRHIEHFLSLGGEDVICFGSDFDGCDLPKDIEGCQSMEQIYEMLLHHNYKESIIRKIFYENALNFFENFDNQRIM